MLLAAATIVYYLAIMPTGQKTVETRDLFKPFDVEEEYPTEELCHAAAKATLKVHLQMRGLPPGTTANYSCSIRLKD